MCTILSRRTEEYVHDAGSTDRAVHVGWDPLIPLSKGKILDLRERIVCRYYVDTLA